MADSATTGQNATEKKIPDLEHLHTEGGRIVRIYRNPDHHLIALLHGNEQKADFFEKVHSRLTKFIDIPEMNEKRFAKFSLFLSNINKDIRNKNAGDSQLIEIINAWLETEH